MEKSQTEVNDILSQCGLLRKYAHLLATVSSTWGQCTVSTGIWGSKESTVVLIQSVSLLFFLFTLKHIFTPWSSTFKENLKAIVHLFSSSSCNCIVTYLFWLTTLECIVVEMVFQHLTIFSVTKHLYIEPCAEKEVWAVEMEWNSRYRGKRMSFGVN